jgi:hypothetical protein
MVTRRRFLIGAAASAAVLSNRTESANAAIDPVNFGNGIYFVSMPRRAGTVFAYGGKFYSVYHNFYEPRAGQPDVPVEVVGSFPDFRFSRMASLPGINSQTNLSLMAGRYDDLLRVVYTGYPANLSHLGVLPSRAILMPTLAYNPIMPGHSGGLVSDSDGSVVAVIGGKLQPSQSDLRIITAQGVPPSNEYIVGLAG